MTDRPARNALANERSPFLQHGGTQPVDWMPWGEAAFEKSRREDRPVLLDIGAVWCHWCHVMDRESYEDVETAALINELFVPVKVDRDEKPAVDARYQRAVQLLTGQGGWPLTAFLTPDGEAFYGGTYFPPDDRHGRPAFRRVLREVARVWRDERDRARSAATQIGERLDSAAGAEARAGELSQSILDETLDELANSFDFRHGGFGRAPKFPNPGALDLLVDEAVENGTDWARRVVDETLRGMIRGGFHDQIGGGFHRYSTDARWIIPHFEKMASDNATLLATCARAYAAFGEPTYAAAAGNVLKYYRDVAPDLVEEGGFPASQDADHSPDDDGDYWTWTRQELRAVLQDETLLRVAIQFYGLDDAGAAMHHDPERRVLFQALTLDALAAELDVSVDEAGALVEQVRERLKRARDARPRPYVDTTLYAGWVSLVVSGCMAAARYLDDDAARRDGLRALTRVWDDGFRVDRGVLHRLGDDESGFHIDDQAHTMLACLDTFEVTQDEAWLSRARRLGDVMIARFRDPATGALQDRPRDERAVVPLLERPYMPVADAPSPSGNGSAALAWLRLHALTGDDTAREAGHGVLSAFAGSAPKLGSSAATYMKAMTWMLRPVTTVVIVDEAGGGGALLREALRSYRPRTTVRRFTAGSIDVDALSEPVRAMVTGDVPRAYVCAGRSCAAPVSDAAALADVLRTVRG
ncbi:thioredoxin domain-containing protein [soil metagenome]